jgi:hypothetical protein
MEEKYFNSDSFVVRPISKNVAKELIVKNHYSHKWSLCQIAYGIFYKENKQNKFFEGNTEKLIGTCVYGSPVGRSAADSFSEIITKKDVFELVRLWVADGYGKNIESWFVSQTFKQLKKDWSNIKVILSYSDEEQGHKGIIYQALGFYYQGNKSIALMPNYSISLVGPPDYKWMHSRTVNSIYGSHNLEHLKKKIGCTFWRKKESTKHRYFYILANKKEKKKILSNLKHPCLSYPKNTVFEEEIEEIKVESNIENPFFT